MAKDDGKRRLKVLQPEGDEGEPRPSWHWSLIGGTATFIAWLPLAYLAQLWAQKRMEALGSKAEAAEMFTRMTAGDRMAFAATAVLGPILSLAAAAFLGGLLVGRFGGDAGKKEATAGGLGVGLLAAAMGIGPFLKSGDYATWTISAIVMLIAAAVPAHAGAWFGLRKRKA
jgi:hypothetical protein